MAYKNFINRTLPVVDATWLNQLDRIKVDNYDLTLREAALNITPLSPQYAPGNVLRYTADPVGLAAGTILADIPFGTARQVMDYRGGYVPRGTYKIQATTSIQGMWGEGWVYGNTLGSNYLYIPRSYQEFGSLQRIFSQLQKVRAWIATVAMMGDSICEGYDSGPSTGGQISNTWFYRLMSGIMWLTGQIGQPGGISNFNDPTRYGLSLSGTATSLGTNGPVKASLIMAVGSVITFTGAFPRIAVWAQQSAGAGSLQFRLNGSLYDTLSWAGATTSDVVKTTAANSGVNGTHTITCTGAPVEITLLLQSVGAPSNTTWPVYMAKSGESSSLYDGTTLDSVRRILHGPNNSTSGRAVVFFQMMVNDYLASSSTAKTSLAYRAKLERIFSALTADGHQPVMVIPPAPDPVTRPGFGGEPFVTYAARAREASEAYGVPVVDANDYDMWTENMLPDGVHPSSVAQGAVPPGYDQLYRTLTEQLVWLDSWSPAGLAGLREYTPVLSEVGSYTAQKGFYAVGPVYVDVEIEITVNVGIVLTAPLTITLPLKSALSQIPSGTAGPSFGWTGQMGLCQGIVTAAGFTQLVANVQVNNSLVFIRCINPVAGTRSDITSLANGAVINLKLRYPRGE